MKRATAQAAASASSLGRGATLQAPVPSARRHKPFIPGRRNGPQTPPPPGGRGTPLRMNLEAPNMSVGLPRSRQPIQQRADSGPRSKLASAVLSGPQHSRSRSPHRRHGRDSNEDQFNRPRMGKMRRQSQINSSSTQARRKLFTPTERAEALKGLNAVRALSENKPATAGKPFAWGDLSAVLSEMPEGHWAQVFVQGVVRSLEANPTVPAEQKKEMLREVLESLSRLSSLDANQEKFNDAEAGN